MSILNFPTTGGAVGDTQTIEGVTYELVSLSPRLWKRRILATEVNNITNNYDSSTTVNAPTFVPDDGGSAFSDNINQDIINGTLTITGTNDETLIASLFTDGKARSAVSNSPITLASNSSVNGVVIATLNDVAAADEAATRAYFSGLGPFVGGTRFTPTNANVGKTSLDVPGSDITIAYYFSSDKSWRVGDELTSNLLGRFGG